MTVTCAECGRDIVRVLVGGIHGWGHATNPGPNHHYARPATPTPAQQTEDPHFLERPARSAARLPASRARVDAG